MACLPGQGNNNILVLSGHFRSLVPWFKRIGEDSSRNESSSNPNFFFFFPSEKWPQITSLDTLLYLLILPNDFDTLTFDTLTFDTLDI